MRIAIISCLISATAWGTPLQPAGEPLLGRYEYVFVGASFTESHDDGNDVNAKCLKTSASTVVAGTDIPSTANLVRATLYLAGSLLDDGDDDLPGGSLFSLNDPGDQSAVLSAARQSADLSVNYQPPGSVVPIPVVGSGNDLLIDVFPQGEPEPGTVAFFVTKIDVTNTIRNAGLSALAGTHTVSGFLADVCNGPEATCGESECAVRHSKGNASFGLLLIFEDPTFPVVSLNVYEGLEALVDTSFASTLKLQDGQPLSDPAAGSLTVYALEGDLAESSASATGPCNSQEYIRVDGDPDGPGACLPTVADPSNPHGNIFNSTINTQAATPVAELTCGISPRDAPECCSVSANTVCGEAGVDLDRFDISAGLAPGGTSITFEYGTGADRIAMAVAVLSVNVFEAILHVDTQVRIPGALNGFVQLGAPFEYAIAISNTGNAPATGVRMLMSAPRFTRDLAILEFPEGAQDLSQQVGGAQNNGLIRVEDITVPPGNVAEVRAQLVATCAALHEELATTLQVAFDQGPAFSVDADVISGAGPGLGPTEAKCDGIDPTGPFAGRTFLMRNLRGGGAPACAASGALSFAWLLVPLLLLKRGRRRRSWWLVVTLASMVALFGCGNRRGEPEDPPPDPPRNIRSLMELPGSKCDALGLSVRVTRVDQSTFCIDRFEAGIDDGDLGNAQQGLTADDPTVDGSTTAIAQSGLNIVPATGLSWYQAKSACLNAGKRLCTRAEWERACRGLSERTYPYGDEYVDDACNGFYNFADERPSRTGSLSTCGSDFFVYDLSGNVEEWVEDPVTPPGGTPNAHRYFRGGSYRSNAVGLTCFGAEYHASPGEAGQSEVRGFRCCSDDP